MPDAHAKADNIRHLVETALREHESALVHYCSGLLNGDWDRARDVVQDAFLKLCRQDPAAVGQNVKSWLFTVCRNRAYDILRGNKRWKTEDNALEHLQNQAPDPSENAGQRDAGRDILACVKTLPLNQQDVVRQRFQQNLSYKEIAAITGISTGQVGFLLHDAMRRLREKLEARRRQESTGNGGTQ